MDVYNPYVAAILSGLIVYLYTYKSNDKDGTQDNKHKKQTNLNYVFVTGLFVFIGMNYYNSNSSVIEPTMLTKYDD
jgi:NhaP-type Na+/H+ or K+/H+ antiporter